MANFHSGAMASLEAMIAGVGAQYYDKQIPKDMTSEGLKYRKGVGLLMLILFLCSIAHFFRGQTISYESVGLTENHHLFWRDKQGAMPW